MRRAVLYFILLVLLANFIYTAGFCGDIDFEKGDAIYRSQTTPLLGHAGIYCDWECSEVSNPKPNYFQQKIVESNGNPFKVFPSVQEITFVKFLQDGSFKSVRTKNFTTSQRRTIVSTARSQLGKEYNFFWGLVTQGHTWFVKYSDTSYIDLDTSLEWVNNCAGYAHIYFNCFKPIDNALLWLGSDDGIKVWLNGVHIWTNDIYRQFKQDEDVVREVSLLPGWNRLLLTLA